MGGTKNSAAKAKSFVEEVASKETCSTSTRASNDVHVLDLCMAPPISPIHPLPIGPMHPAQALPWV